MTKLIVFITTLVSIALFIACSNTSINTATTAGNSANSSMADKRSTPPSSTPAGQTDEMAAGRDLYVKNCANCHKESGEGGPVVVDGRKMKPDNLTDDRRKKLSDDKYMKSMIEGIEDEGMPSFKDKMTETEMREVIKYIRVALQKQDEPLSPTANSANISAAPANK
jgi:mono/diheme cytochrome c family protein